MTSSALEAISELAEESVASLRKRVLEQADELVSERKRVAELSAELKEARRDADKAERRLYKYDDYFDHMPFCRSDVFSDTEDSEDSEENDGAENSIKSNDQPEAEPRDSEEPAIAVSWTDEESPSAPEPPIAAAIE